MHLPNNNLLKPFSQADSRRGSSTLFGLLACLILSFFFILFLYHHSTNLRRVKERAHIFLCTKELILNEEKLVKKMETLNLVIKNSTYVQMAKILFPALAAIPAGEIKQTSKQLQQGLIISFEKKLLLMRVKSCPFDLSVYKTPYKSRGLALERGARGESMLRQKQWKYKIRGKETSLQTEIKVTGGMIKRYQALVSESTLEDIIRVALPY